LSMLYFFYIFLVYCSCNITKNRLLTYIKKKNAYAHATHIRYKKKHYFPIHTSIYHTIHYIYKKIESESKSKKKST
ncbi:hypothetical protein J3Q64DRAFT_1721926, partial [Phycomyces blakesleeanus]